MKKFASISILIAVIMLFGACGSAEKTPAVADIMQKIRSDIDLPDMADRDTAYVASSFGVADADIVEATYIIAGSGATADEVLIVRMKDSAAAAGLESKIEARKTQQADLFQDYNATEMPKIENAVIEIRGAYAFFAICNDNSKAKSIFASFF